MNREEILVENTLLLFVGNFEKKLLNALYFIL